MLGPYISNLFTNCKSLEKKSEYIQGEVQDYFISEIKTAIVGAGLKSEADLISQLVQKPFRELMGLFSAHPCLEIFYLVNSLSEYEKSECYDELGRFTYDCSVQRILGIEKNLVLQKILEEVQRALPLRKSFRYRQHRSYFFLSHDLDSLYGSLMQDGLSAVKQGRLDVVLWMFAGLAIQKPAWFNMDHIMKMESEYDFKSTFYWLVNKGRVDRRQKNSDYNINSPKVLGMIKEIEKRGFENGLHKSVAHGSFRDELKKMPAEVKSNRFHYLKFDLPNAYQQIESSGLKMDCSLGFAERYGFRNSYGYPFVPYNIQTSKPFSFLEVPLHIMDGTFQRYMKVPVNKTASMVIDFFESNKHDCLLSVLWHNQFFAGYKHRGYREEYRKILAYLYEEKFENINANRIIKEFGWSAAS